MRVSKSWTLILLLLSAVFVLLALVSREYIWLYLSRKTDPRPSVAVLRDPETSKNPEFLLTEANRLAWLFNWPKAEPLYVRAEELFKQRGDTRNEIYARVGRIRAQAETMSWVDVSEMLGKQALGHRAISSTMVYVGTSDLQASEAAAEAMMTMY